MLTTIPTQIEGYVLLEDELLQVILALVSQDMARKADAVVMLQDKLKGNVK